MTTRFLLLALALTLSASRVEAQKLKVACTLPTLAALVVAVGGDRVETFSLAAGDQDPHFVSPTPLLMKRVREADLLLEIGMQLETWADEVANGSGNPRIFRGAAGRVATAQGIPKLEVPALVTRALGDVHPEGNPHVWLDPMRAKLLAQNIAAALAAAAPEDATYFTTRLADFERKIDIAMFGDRVLQVVGSPKLTRLTLDGRLHEFLDSNDLDGKKLSALAGGWLAKARPLRGRKLIEFHKVWVYFAAAFGFELVGTIEEKPGIAPGPQHLQNLVASGRRAGVHLILVDNFYDPSLPERVGLELKASVVVLPNQVGGERGVNDYFALIDHVLNQLVTPLSGQALAP